MLSNTHNFGRNKLMPIAHDIAWDAELSAAAALAVAALIEQASAYSGDRVVASLLQMRNFWLLKKEWCEQSGRDGAGTANDRAKRLASAADALKAGKAIRAAGPKLVVDFKPVLSGEPVSDWRTARELCSGHDDLLEIASQARMVRLFHARDPLAMALGSIWSQSASYIGAMPAISAVLDQQRLIGAEQTPRGCVLMTIHKSKGKEFDGVFIVEGYRGGSLMKANEAPAYESSRRVLRVVITRARHLVRIIRPEGAVAFFS
ncbi:ATP-binding domain-containing protein [Bosea sp. CCNWLW174]|uniref:ATP-binding domain-containing protein n=1 Tax=unclassified Bosea (in: a-proteobacteria) TaxID=2653178 RepID=UPI0030144CFE